MPLNAQDVNRPAIAISNGRAHLAWKDAKNRSCFTQFEAQSSIWYVDDNAESVYEPVCDRSIYTKPSISVLYSPCKPDVVRVASLFVWNPQPYQVACNSIGSWLGPEVRQRNQVNQT